MSCAFVISFQPLRARLLKHLLTISFSDRAALVVRLRGTGVEAVVELHPMSLDFGQVSDSSTEAVTLTNTGSAPLQITSIDISPGSPFSVRHNCPRSLQIGASCTFWVTFAPRYGPQSATVTIVASGRGQKTLKVSGVGVPG